MGKKIPMYEYPEFNDTFNELFEKLLNESGRGAILIGTSYVEENLEKFILKILPKKHKKYTSRLLNYPGPLSSFSAKLELSYAFRLIPERTYNALNYLRKIRNEAAHSSNDFKLSKIEIDNIFNIGEGFRTMITESSMKMMVGMKIELLKEGLSKIDTLNEDEINSIILSKLKEKETIKILEEQLPHWKLILGISLICGMLRFKSDETLEKLQNNETWSGMK